MTYDEEQAGLDNVIATIGNSEDPAQNVDIRYMKGENAFVTSGIERHFGEREILIPAQFVVMDFQLMGAIVSAILERLSLAHDREASFRYVPRFRVLDKTYSLAEWGDYVRLSVVE